MVASSGLCTGIKLYYIDISHPMIGEINSVVVVIYLLDVVGSMCAM